jgi:diguanylate cyclase (GGDEF)-like protein
MRIRSILFFAFLSATLVPTALYGWWSYTHGTAHDFRQFKDHQQAIARNVTAALEHYRADVRAAFDVVVRSVSEEPEIKKLMANAKIGCVLWVNPVSDAVDRAYGPNCRSLTGDPRQLKRLVLLSKSEHQAFSQLIKLTDGTSVLTGKRAVGDRIALAAITTEFFDELPKTAGFGEIGLISVADKYGRPLTPHMVSSFEEYTGYSGPALVDSIVAETTEIAGEQVPAGDFGHQRLLISEPNNVAGPGWRIRIHQSLPELYASDRQYLKFVLVTLAVGIGVAIALVLFFIFMLARPLEKMSEAVRNNAKDGRLSALPATTKSFGFVELSQFQSSYNWMVRRVNMVNQEIEAIAFTDRVTGLHSREYLYANASRLIDREIAAKSGGALVFVDLDGFKAINDIHGHDVGDVFLKECAQKLRDVAESAADRHQSQGAAGPVIARIGGDEFTILIPGIYKPDEVELFLAELNVALSTPSASFAQISSCSASIGCSRFPAHGRTLEDLLKRADIAMYHAKEQGKNRAQLFGPEIGSRTLAELRQDVEHAIAEGEMLLEYQPKVASATRRLVGVEALVRWNHPTRGKIPPMDWIPNISNTPIMTLLGEWVIQQAIRDHRRWKLRGLDLPIAVNIGSVHFSSPGFVPWLIETAAAMKFQPSRLEIEVTEEILLGSQTDTIKILDDLHAAGFTTSVDDFGIGYSNIARVGQLPFDCLKIDRSIVAGSQTDPRLRSLMSCIVTMAKELDCKVVAEGVETTEEAAFSSACGADVLQGFHFAPSMQAADLEIWCRQYNEKIYRRIKTAVA